jgi:hypothetical protein
MITLEGRIGHFRFNRSRCHALIPRTRTILPAGTLARVSHVFLFRAWVDQTLTRCRMLLSLAFGIRETPIGASLSQSLRINDLVVSSAVQLALVVQPHASFRAEPVALLHPVA